MSFRKTEWVKKKRKTGSAARETIISFYFRTLIPLQYIDNAQARR